MVVRPPSRSKLALAALAVLLASSLLRADATGQATSGADMAIPGRINVIEAVEHPGDLDPAGSGRSVRLGNAHARRGKRMRQI